jgi:hypothetical protein
VNPPSENGRTPLVGEARVAAQESIGAGSRLATLEAQAGTPNALRVLTRVAAAATSPAATVEVIQTFGRLTVGDGMGTDYRRTTGPLPGSADGFTAANGSVWLAVPFKAAQSDLDAARADLSLAIGARLNIGINDITLISDRGIGPDSPPSDGVSGGMVPYGAHGAKHYIFSLTPGPVGDCLATGAWIKHAEGGDANGPQSAQLAGLFSVTKRSYLTSNKDGEVDALKLAAFQGRKGDVATMIGEASKVRTGTADDTAGITGIELASKIIDTSGEAHIYQHTIMGFYPAAIDPLTGGEGHGLYSEAYRGITHSAFTMSSFPIPGSGPTGYRNVLLATASRLPNDIFFRVVGNVLKDKENYGDIYQGLASYRKIHRVYPNGDYSILSANEENDLFLVSDGGLVTVPGVLVADGGVQLKQSATGSAGGVGFGNTFPGANPTGAVRWFKILDQNGETLYVPAWR